MFRKTHVRSRIHSLCYYKIDDSVNQFNVKTLNLIGYLYLPINIFLKDYMCNEMKCVSSFDI